MIVTVTLNPVLHVRYDAAKVELGGTNQVSRVRYAAGGRGLVVARLLTQFGHDVVAAGLTGGSAGQLIRTELARSGVATQFTRIAAESRRLVRITDASDGSVTSYAEPAPYITTEELGRFAGDYRLMLDGATAVVLCGSLPDSLPPELYGSLTSYAADAGVPVVLDAGGSALRHGAARGPAVVIPDPAHATVEPPPGGTVVRPEGTGVVAVTAAGRWQADAGQAGAGPAGAGADPAGFRDALVAGLVPGVALGWSWPDTLRNAVALAAAVSADGDADLTVYEQLLPKVTLTGPEAG